MTEYEINELRNVYNQLGRLLANAVGDPNAAPYPDPFEPPAKAPDTPRENHASSMADLVTPRQLGMIRALAREARVDADDECQRVNKCRTEELSKRAASSFIDHLKSMQGSPAQRRAS